MAKVIRKVDYFVMQAPNRPGEAARLLKALKKHDVGLLAFTAFPASGGCQVDFVPEDTQKFLRAMRVLEWDVSPRKVGFLVQGKDRTGTMAGVMNDLGKAGVNVTAIDAVTGGKKRFGALFWVKPADVAKASKLLGAK